MIAVDTSVLVDLFRGKRGRGADRLRELERAGTPIAVPAICCQEVLQGALDRREWDKMYDVLSSQIILGPRDSMTTHVQAARIYFDCRRKGVTVRSTVDCFIAALAIEHAAVLLHSDADFVRIAEVCPLETMR
jgi:predicted nucleic acid-binding protein